MDSVCQLQHCLKVVVIGNLVCKRLVQVCVLWELYLELSVLIWVAHDSLLLSIFISWYYSLVLARKYSASVELLLAKQV